MASVQMASVQMAATTYDFQWSYILAKRKRIRQQVSQIAASGSALEKQVQDMLARHKYAAAIRKLQQGFKRNPDQALEITEADIYWQQGQYEFGRRQYAQAKQSFEKVLDSKKDGDIYYWLAKCHLKLEEPAQALALFQTAFETKKLSKEMGGCYLKLLLLNGERTAVESLIKTQAKRFYAHHLHWARGAIALQAGNAQSALTHFKKMSRPASPDDQSHIWIAYAQQQAENWTAAEQTISVGENIFQRDKYKERASAKPPAIVRRHHPALRLLTISQVAQTGRAPWNFSFQNMTDFPQRSNAGWLLELLNLIKQDNVHDAAHMLLDAPSGILKEYSALAQLSRSIFLLAGEQARQQHEFSCSAEFWGEVIDEGDFDPNLALSLYKALDLSGSHREGLRRLEQLMDWVKQQERDSAAWPKPKLDTVFATLHCQRADSYAALGRAREAKRCVEQAEKLKPQSREVIGRKGLSLLRQEPETAIALIRRALDEGSQFKDLYVALTGVLADDPEELKAVRRKFGQRFGDVSIDDEVDIPKWVEALTFQNYHAMAELVEEARKLSPPLKAFKIFLDAATDEPSSGQKITLDKDQATAQWKTLLASQPPSTQVEIIRAIYLIVQQHAKRNKKGITALQSEYYSKMVELAEQQVDGAGEAQLMLLAVRSPSSDNLKPAVEHILSRSPQPSRTLARAQLLLQQFASFIVLRPFLEAQLNKDAQNPLLLLALATTYPAAAAQGEVFYEKGFELARRLQDAEALQAYREDEWLHSQVMTRRILGKDIERINDGPIDMIDIIQRFAKEAFGDQVPPEMMAQMLPELMDEMDDDDESFIDLFRPEPLSPFGRTQSSQRSRKKTNQNRGRR